MVSLVWQSVQYMSFVAFQLLTKALALIFGFFPAASTGWKEILFGLNCNALSLGEPPDGVVAGKVVQDEWHL